MSEKRRDLEPLLKDLSEKTRSFKRNVVSLAVEFKDARSRLASLEESSPHKSLTQQAIEEKARNIEEELSRLRRNLEESNGQLQSSACNANRFLEELDAVRFQLSGAEETANASVASAESAQIQFLALGKELEEKNKSFTDHINHVNNLEEQLKQLQKDLQTREDSQRQLKHEVVRIEKDIMEALKESGTNKDCELRKMLDEFSLKNFEKINKLLSLKDEETAKLRDEISVLSAQWRLKMEDVESQLEKNRRADQELKKRVMKLEFCLHEARNQTRKLQRTEERRDKTVKQLKEDLAATQERLASNDKQNFWESPNFKLVVSISILVLAIFAKQ